MALSDKEVRLNSRNCLFTLIALFSSSIRFILKFCKRNNKKVAGRYLTVS